MSNIITKDDENFEKAIQMIRKDHGDESIMGMKEGFNQCYEVIPTGNLAIDYALGIGGFPKGRIIEIYGPESSGKTTLALTLIANAKRRCTFIDMEHALDLKYAESIGVNLNNFYLAQPDNGEQALRIADTMIRSCSNDIVVIDSVAALTTQAELNGEIGDQTVGALARLMSATMRRLAPNIAKSRTICIFINQIRENIGVMYGPKEVTPGGRALKFYSSVRVDVRKLPQIKDGKEIIGNRTRIKIVKNKLAPPFKEAEVDLIFGKGIGNTSSLVDMAVQEGILVKKGSWYSYGEEMIGQGRDAAVEYLEQNLSIMKIIYDQTKKALFVPKGKEQEKKDPVSQIKHTSSDQQEVKERTS